MVIGQGQDLVPLSQKALVLVIIAGPVGALGLLHHHGGPAALLVIVRVAKHQVIQLLRQRAAQQDCHGHTTGLVAVQRGAEVRQQRRKGLFIPQVVCHQELEPLGVVLCSNLQGADKLVPAQSIELPAGGGLMERPLRRE